MLGRAMSAIRQAWRAFAWYLREVTGESDYERYVAHLRAHHPDQPPPTVKEYWRERYAYEAAHPRSRCC